MAAPKSWAEDLQSYEQQRRVELDPGLFQGPTVGFVRGEISKRERNYNPLLGRFRDDSRESEQLQLEEKVKKSFLNLARDVQLRREAPFDLVTHERKFEAFGPDASAGLEPKPKKKPPFPDTAADYNIISNLPFNEHHWAHPDLRPRPSQRVPKQRLAPAMLHKDFNILTNRYLERHQEKIDRDRELNLLEAAEKLRQTSTFNPVQQRFCDPSHEERMRACEDALVTEIKLRGEEVQPLIYRGNVTNSYDMLNHQVKDRDLLELIEGADAERKVRFRTKHDLEGNIRKLDEAYEARLQRMKANKVAHDRFAPTLDRGFDIVTNQNFGYKGRPVHCPNTRPHQTPWDKVCDSSRQTLASNSARTTPRIEVTAGSVESGAAPGPMKDATGQSEVLDFATLRLKPDSGDLPQSSALSARSSQRSRATPRRPLTPRTVPPAPPIPGSPAGSVYSRPRQPTPSG